jgi:hypothetical protein
VIDFVPFMHSFPVHPPFIKPTWLLDLLLEKAREQKVDVHPVKVSEMYLHYVIHKIQISYNNHPWSLPGVSSNASSWSIAPVIVSHHLYGKLITEKQTVTNVAFSAQSHFVTFYRFTLY